jgi:hypothetical protein
VTCSSMKQPNPERLVVMLGIPATIIELNLQSLFGLHVYSCTYLAGTPQPHPAFGLILDSAVCQPR